MRKALGAIMLLGGFAVAAEIQEWPVYGQDACFRAGSGYARTDWRGVLGGCHQPYCRTDCSGFVSTPVKHQVYVLGAPGEYDYIPIRYDPR